jgi:ATP/maltotriose-dependent transcriptional regulator MalT
MEDALAAGTCDRVELEPLTREQADALVGDGLAPDLREAIHRDAGGNPFYVEQLARAAEHGVLASDRDGNGGEVPGSVTSALSSELARLSPAAALAMRSAAVAGEPFAPELVAAIAELPEAEVLGLIDEGLALGLLRTTEAPRWFVFRHPIVRRAVYESAGGAWRIGAHARAAAALAEAGAPPASRALHVERSARPGDMDAVAVLARAADEAAAHAPATAARWLEAALALVPAGAETAGKRLELLVPLARAQGSSGRLDDSRRSLESLLELLPAELAAVRGRVAGFIAVIDHLRGRHGEARASLERALAELPSGDSAEAASLHVELASDRFFVGDWDGMREHAARADVIARALGGTGLRATAAAILALAEYSLAHIGRARALMEEAADLVDNAPDGDLRLDAFDWLAWCELSMERYEQALVHLERGLAIGRRSGQGSLLMTMRFGRVFGMTSLGRLDSALAESDETLELARVSGSDQLMSWALCLRSWLMLRRGELEQALDLGAESRRLAAEVTSNPFSTVGAGWLAEALIESGAAARGRDELLSALGGEDLPLIERPFHPYLYEVLTAAELALGRVEAAGAWAARAEAALEGVDLGGRRSFALRARAAVSLAVGDAAGAAALALEAADAAGAPQRVDSARCLLLSGRALSARGDSAGAVERIERAHAELAACGAARYRDQAVRELRRLGRRVPGSGRRGSAGEGLASLSGREREVAELVTDRLTNREVAQRLVLSEKTVERHMSRIFQKLGVGSRVELARLVEAERQVVP